MERSAEEARARALAAAGLSRSEPIVRSAPAIAFSGSRRRTPPEETIWSRSTWWWPDAASGSVVVLVEELAAAAPPRALPRDELATWAGGAADDFSDDWAWMAAEIHRRRRRAWRRAPGRGGGSVGDGDCDK